MENVLSFLSVTEEKRKNKLFQATQMVLFQCILREKNQMELKVRAKHLVPIREGLCISTI